MHKKLVVFDMDDVLWNLNDKASKMAGVDISKLTTFSVFMNLNLTESERNAMLEAYQDINLFRNILFKEEIISLVNQINARNDCDVRIISNCTSHEIADLKMSQLLNVLNIPKKHIILNIIDIKNSTKKKLPSDIYLYVDDSHHNIVISGAKHCIMPAKNWNNVLTNGLLDGIPVDRPQSDKELCETVLNYLR